MGLAASMVRKFACSKKTDNQYSGLRCEAEEMVSKIARRPRSGIRACYVPSCGEKKHSIVFAILCIAVQKCILAVIRYPVVCSYCTERLSDEKHVLL